MGVVYASRTCGDLMSHSRLSCSVNSVLLCPLPFKSDHLTSLCANLKGRDALCSRNIGAARRARIQGHRVVQLAV
jgi:hypothetical protein